MTTPLLLLRTVQPDVHIRDMELLTIATLLDMYTELQGDDSKGEFNYIWMQADMDRF